MAHSNESRYWEIVGYELTHGGSHPIVSDDDHSPMVLDLGHEGPLTLGAELMSPHAGAVNILDRLEGSRRSQSIELPRGEGGGDRVTAAVSGIKRKPDEWRVLALNYGNPEDGLHFDGLVRRHRIGEGAVYIAIALTHGRYKYTPHEGQVALVQSVLDNLAVTPGESQAVGRALPEQRSFLGGALLRRLVGRR